MPASVSPCAALPAVVGVHSSSSVVPRPPGISLRPDAWSRDLAPPRSRLPEAQLPSTHTPPPNERTRAHQLAFASRCGEHGSPGAPAGLPPSKEKNTKL